MLTYAIGDIHGCFELLRSALASITRHARGRAHQLVFLGDYIDRGLDTRATIECLMQPRNEGRVVCLMGNHEDMLLRHLRSGSRRLGELWMNLGGPQTLASYELESNSLASAARLPQAHLSWMLRRPTIYPTLDRIFVHAGIDPGTPLEVQGPKEHLWIRERFLTADPSLFRERRHVVHGHTPLWAGKPKLDVPELLSHRTNLDTGAYLTAVLAVGVFEIGSAGPVDLIMVS